MTSFPRVPSGRPEEGEFAAYAQTDWSTYQTLPAFAANNKGNAYRIFLELEASNFSSEKKPDVR